MKTLRYKPLPILTGLLCLYPFAQWALADTLTDVEVSATRESLNAASVRTAQEKLSAIPGGTEVVDHKAFEEGRAMTVKDMLDFTPGVIAQSRVNEESRLSIRGSGLSRTFHLRGIRLLQDGIPINLADGSSDFQDIDPLALQHIEVFKGSNALQFGAASLGGAINFVTPTGYSSPSLSTRLDVGSDAFTRAQIQGGAVQGDWDYFASLSALKSDGYRDFSAQQSTRLNANMGYKISPTLESRFYIIHGDVNQELPGNLTKAQMQANPQQANASSAASNSQRDFLITRIANKTTWISPTGVEHNAGIYYVDKNLYHPLSFGLTSQLTTNVGLFGNRISESTIFGHGHTLTLGFNTDEGTTEARVFNHQQGQATSLRSYEDQKSHNIELYGESRLHLTPTVEWVTGLQYTHAKRTANDQFLSDGNQSYERRYAQFNPKLGILWQATPDVQVFGNVSHGYEPPTFSETSSSRTLNGQKSDTVELGSRGTQGELKWDASVYYAKLKDEFVTFEYAPNQSAILNAKSSTHQGIELGLSGPVTQTLSWQTAYTLGRFRFDSDPVYGNNTIPGAPEQYLRGKLDYKHPSGWTISPNIEYVPKGYAIDLKNTFNTDPYTLVGINATYPLTHSTRLLVDGRNLTNKTYAATSGVIINANGQDAAQFTPGQGRSIFVGIKTQW